jgi:hypothetical protein
VSEANKFFISLDWLSVTFKGAVNHDGFLASYATSEKSASVTPQHGYNWGYRSENGAMVFGHSTRDEMGVHVSFSGSTLRNIEQRGITTHRLLSEAIALHGKVTRLDLAKDGHDTGIDLKRIAEAGVNNRYSGNARKCNLRRENNGGLTLYIGSRQSERFARIYDKAIEQGVQGDWLRYEFELSGDVAKQIARVLVSGEVSWDEVFNTMAKGFFQTTEGGYGLFLQGGSLPGLPKIEKTSDREAWIYSQVIKAVTEHFAEHPDSKAVEALFYALKPYFEPTTENTDLG